MSLISPLIVLLSVTSFCVGCAFYIWKSLMKSNDKIIAIIALLGLMSMVTIINESKRFTAVKKEDKFEYINFN